MPADHHDVLVIGSGPGGATTAARVAETGKRVLMLERGDFLPRERDNWNSQAVFGDAKYTADETFYDLHDRPFRPELHYYVGGNSKVYGAALLRLLPGDFGEVQHRSGMAPAWPLTYDDMEPYYVRAEHLFWVHGQHGEDPFAGNSSEDYKYPPVSHEPRIQRLSDDLEKLGLHPFHLPLGVRLNLDAAGRATTDSPCIRCDRVDGFPCLLGAKADAEQAVIRPALAAHPNLALMTRTTVERLLTDAGGRSVTGVAVTLPDGSPHTLTADIVVLSAGAILSAALLLRSANDKHPHGLANSSDMVGRNYMRHNNLALIAFSREPNPTVFQKTLALNDFYGPGQEWPYPMGNIQMLGKSDDWQIKGAAPRKLAGLPGIVAPATVRVSRAQLEALAQGLISLEGFLPGAALPLIVRPVGSHAGTGLEKLERLEDLAAYLEGQAGGLFYLTPFVDYSGPDGRFRKLRVAMIEGRPFIAHMAVSEHWMVHYLNAGMDRDGAKRAEEAAMMATFDEDFALRHATAFKGLAEAIGLDYFAIDCAEDRQGRLLIFETDTAMIIHDMDPPDLYPYKEAAMVKLFAAFQALLARRIGSAAV